MRQPLCEWDLFNATISRFSENNLGGIPETDWPYLDRLCVRLLPFTLSKISSQGLEKILDKSLSEEKKDQLQYNFDQSILYSQRVGNIYTGSLFLGLLSLLENDPQLKAGDRIALFSYGSGAVSEIFSANLVPGFEQLLDHKRMEKLDQRTVLSVADYERLFYEEVDLDPSGNQVFEPATHQTFALTEIKEHQRTYQKVEK